MPAFDEILALETKEQELMTELRRQLASAREISTKVSECQQDLHKMEIHISSMIEVLTELRSRETKVVLLAEWDSANRILADNRHMIIAKRQEINRLTTQAKILDKSVPVLQARVKQLRAELSSYGKVLQFP